MNVNSIKILETKKLILRTFDEADIDSMTAIDQDPKVCEFLPGIGNLQRTAAGITYHSESVRPGESYRIDDDCLLWLLKELCDQ